MNTAIKQDSEQVMNSSLLIQGPSKMRCWVREMSVRCVHSSRQIWPQLILDGEHFSSSFVASDRREVLENIKREKG